MSNLSMEYAESLFRRGSAVFALFFIFLFLIPSGISAQWRQLLSAPGAGWPGGTFPCIYFLDLPGPPRIGFVTSPDGTLKTTDGGFTWSDPSNSLWPFDFTFKDSVTGWASSYDGSIYKTTDGGLSWIPLTATNGAGGAGIYFDSGSDGLFTGGMSYGSFDGTDFSWDEGATWVRQLDLQGGNGFAFLNNDSGILTSIDAISDASDIIPWYETTDAGRHWQPIAIDSPCYQPLAISGTSTYFGCTVFGTILRSDDAGITWDSISSLPWPKHPYPDGTWGSGASGLPSNGCIEGDSSDLYTVTGDGCYHSTDLGKTWKYLCGQPSDFLVDNRFYAKGHIVYIQTAIYKNEFWQGYVWRLNLDSMQYFQTTGGLMFPDSSKRTTVQPGTPVTINYSPQTSDPIGIDTGHLVFHYDSNALSLKSLKLPPSWIILDSSTTGGILNLRIIDTTASQLPTPIVQLTFNTYLSSPTTEIYLDSADLSGHRLNCDCQALSIIGPDSVEIDFTGCGDSTILAAMNHAPPFEIQSVTPNPASQSLGIRFQNKTNAPSQCELLDVLGKTVWKMTTEDNTYNLDVSGFPDGVYFLRATAGNTRAVTRKILIER